MLPPKLAQIIINLAKGIGGDSQLTVLDPFCGTGVVLQECLLMGLNAYGTDIDKRMIENTRLNLNWLNKRFNVSDNFQLELGDATTHSWSGNISCVASETYLGRPFTEYPSKDISEKTASDVNVILKKFLANIKNQIKPGTRLCLAIPAWKIAPHKFNYLPLIDHLGDLGYNRVKFNHVRDKDLIYFREQQFVARQLLVITRK